MDPEMDADTHDEYMLLWIAVTEVYLNMDVSDKVRWAWETNGDFFCSIAVCGEVRRT